MSGRVDDASEAQVTGTLTHTDAGPEIPSCSDGFAPSGPDEARSQSPSLELGLCANELAS